MKMIPGETGKKRDVMTMMEEETANGSSPSLSSPTRVSPA
jgi:hypothetical protein